MHYLSLYQRGPCPSSFGVPGWKGIDGRGESVASLITMTLQRHGIIYGEVLAPSTFVLLRRLAKVLLVTLVQRGA